MNRALCGIIFLRVSNRRKNVEFAAEEK